MNDKKGNTVLLTVIAIATLLVAIVGATFAYFTASISGNDTASSVIVETASLGNIVYENGTEIKLENALPGATSNEITFTVSIEDNDFSMPYELYWVNVKNNFIGTDLVYSLNGTQEGVDGAAINSQGQLLSQANGNYMPVPAESADPVLIGQGTLGANGDIHHYKMKVQFQETYTDQNSNQGKSFSGVINVKTSGSDTRYYNSENPNGTATKPTSAY